MRYLDKADSRSETKAIGVLYLDSREKGSLLAPHTRTALDTLATEAGVAIENARLYRETLEKARIEQELRIAAEIQRALLPEGTHNGTLLRGGGTSRARPAPLAAISTTYSRCPTAKFGVPAGRRRRQGPAGGAADLHDPGHLLGVRVERRPIPAETIAQMNRVLTGAPSTPAT